MSNNEKFIEIYMCCLYRGDPWKNSDKSIFFISFYETKYHDSCHFKVLPLIIKNKEVNESSMDYEFYIMVWVFYGVPSVVGVPWVPWFNMYHF